MSTSRSHRLATAYGAYRLRLLDDAQAYTMAALALGQAIGAGQDTGRASPDMVAALAKWRQDAGQALARVQALPGGTPSKALAVQALQTLNDALTALSAGLTVADANQARGALAQAAQLFDAYAPLTAALDRRMAR